MKYDDASWHYGGEFPSDLPEESGGIHIGMFLCWCLLNGLAGNLHIEDSEDGVDDLNNRKITGTEFLFQYCDEKFTDEDLNEEGNEFALFYFGSGDGYGPYVRDYQEALNVNDERMYYVKDAWENYDKLSPVIEAAYRKWKTQG